MGFVQTLVSGLLSIVAYGLLMAAVYKIFQLHTEMGEIKALLKDIRNNTDAPRAPLASAPAPQAVQAAPIPAPAPISAPTIAPAAPSPIPSELSQPMSVESAEALLRQVAMESELADRAEVIARIAPPPPPQV